MSCVIDVPRLIAEVQKRPAIWNGRQKVRPFLPKMWDEVAESLGVDVNLCKRKWKNLRDAYHAEVRRSERRIQKDKFLGLYNPDINRYKSKWIHFPILSFLKDVKPYNNISFENQNDNSNSNDNNSLDESYDDMMQEQNFHSGANIKMEPSYDIENSQSFNGDDDDDDTANDLLFEEFQNMATPKAAKSLSATFSLDNRCENNSNPTQFTANPSSEETSKCKCSERRSDDQVHFLQDLGREEQILMKSTRQDISRCNNLDHIGDFDYNFLVSFLPQMKKMTELQNLQFRSKMCETALNILATSTSQNPLNTNLEEPKV